ncbi:MAG: nuclear transport factor 2 family protein [Candidatus Acidiferrum sp.]
MYRLAAVLAMWVALAPAWNPQHNDRLNECYERCNAPQGDPDAERQEIVILEKEAAHAIQLSDATFFRRVYSDDFSGTLSHGERVDKAHFLSAVQSTKYDSFNASDIQVHVYRDTAVATCLWSSRGTMKGQAVYAQMRVMHIYVNGQDGWRVVAGQASALPPYLQQSL